MICDTCIHKEVCYEIEEDREALKFCGDYFNLEDELEKIKAEILTQNPKFTIGCEMKMCLEIINNRISELKGE